MEIWKDVVGYEGFYKVSNLGRVKSINRFDVNGRYWESKIIKFTLDKRGYPRLTLNKNGCRSVFRVHRLVAIAFIDNPMKKPQVNHIDENKLNNCVDNLEWCTKIENIRHGTAKRVNQISLSGDFINNFPSLSEVKRVLGFHPSNISKVCNGLRNNANGFKWEWSNV
ncbi:MAG: NUMOD4 domain-containing protein [Bacteriovoracaceae bacterium]